MMETYITCLRFRRSEMKIFFVYQPWWPIIFRHWQPPPPAPQNILHFYGPEHLLQIFRNTFTAKNDSFPFFSYSKEKDMFGLQVLKQIRKFRDVFSRFEKNKNVINIFSVKNWFELLRTLFKPFNCIKWRENVCHSRCKRRSHGHAILLFKKNITKYEMQFLSSLWQNVLKLRFICTLHSRRALIELRRFLYRRWMTYF